MRMAGGDGDMGGCWTVVTVATGPSVLTFGVKTEHGARNCFRVHPTTGKRTLGISAESSSRVSGVATMWVTACMGVHAVCSLCTQTSHAY